MSSTETYRVWFTLTVSHEYYGEHACPFELRIKPPTEALMKRYAAIYRQTGVSAWVFLAPSFLPDPTDPKQMEFELIPQDSLFYYVTAHQSEHLTGKGMKVHQQPTGKRIINLPFSEEKSSYTIRFRTVSKYWEFILINRSKREEKNLRIEEKRKRVEFGELIRTHFLSLPNALRTRSKEKVRLQKGYDYLFRLLEERETGERLVSECLPPPRPDEASVESKSDTITTYLYI